MAKQYQMDMCSGSVLKKLLLFSLPLMASGVLQLLFNAADVIVVGRFAGDISMGAVGSTSSLINLFTNLFVGLSVGVNVIAARAHGASSASDMHDTVHTSMLLSVISGALLAVVGFILAPQMLILMNATENQLPLAVMYLRIYFLGMPAMMVYNFGGAILRAVGDTKRPLYFLTAAGVINVLLNLLFVIALKMDVAGVALATVLSQCVSAGLTVRCLIKDNTEIHLELKQLKIRRRILFSVMRVGLPAGFQGTVFSLSNVVIQSSVNLFGDTVVSGNSAASSVEGFIYMAMNTFHQAAISFTGQHVGAKKYSRIPRILACSLLCVSVTGLIFGWTAFMLGRPLLGIYTNSENSVEVVNAGMARLSVIATTYALCGAMDVMVGMLRGLGYSIMPMIVSLLGACGLRILWIATVFQIPEYHTPHAIYLSYPMSWGITLLVHIICYIVIWRRLRRRESVYFADEKAETVK
ncbi:MAG: MATE family efflux transporter [Lachnospiraceae bacterium]|nr:MATE family efflux transporter [Ruminococcus sp.]MCM1274733.1 MATE family efflux transporter [Lachnospiraceae bacterium]